MKTNFNVSLVVSEPGRTGSEAPNIAFADPTVELQLSRMDLQAQFNIVLPIGNCTEDDIEKLITELREGVAFYKDRQMPTAPAGKCVVKI